MKQSLQISKDRVFSFCQFVHFFVIATPFMNMLPSWSATALSFKLNVLFESIHIVCCP